MQAIILAGGFGTRLQSVIHDIPKPMASVQGKPFLSYLLDQLNHFGFTKVVLSVGYKYEVIQQFYGSAYRNLELVYAVEKEPLGTGGAIWNAIQYTQDEAVLVMNGDSVFLCDINKLLEYHIKQKAMLTMALKESENFERYGTVVLNQENRIVGFKEKQFVNKGILNSGIYIINRTIINNFDVEKNFSFEKEILEKGKDKLFFVGKVFKSYFIDIGIPEDFFKANQYLAERTAIFDEKFFENITSEWTLFLDRDGVINKQVVGDYARNWGQFEFLPNVLDALKILAQKFSKIIVVTNQQCVAKGLVEKSTIEHIHQKMKEEIEKQNGRIDAVFFAPNLSSENHIDRKPNIGMLLQAKYMFPNIDLIKSIMVGDSEIDLQFAKKAGIKSVFVGNKEHATIPDVAFEDLHDFAQHLCS
jgi:D-glycero-alpha-D-manno-heptose 1-phosphate guanylyltransferase